MNILVCLPTNLELDALKNISTCLFMMAVLKIRFSKRGSLMLRLRVDEVCPSTLTTWAE